MSGSELAIERARARSRTRRRLKLSSESTSRGEVVQHGRGRGRGFAVDSSQERAVAPRVTRFTGPGDIIVGELKCSRSGPLAVVIRKVQQLTVSLIYITKDAPILNTTDDEFLTINDVSVVPRSSRQLTQVKLGLFPELDRHKSRSRSTSGATQSSSYVTVKTPKVVSLLTSANSELI